MMKVQAMMKDAAAEWSKHPRQLLFIAFLAFVAMLSYGLCRPSVESLFLASYEKSALPRVWLWVAASAALVSAVYARYARVVSIAKVGFWIGMVSGLGFACLCVGLFQGRGDAAFVAYIWKDVYIVVFVEAFWTFANAIHPYREAKWTYGLFLVAGTLGSMAGEAANAAWAGDIGAVWMVAATVPVLFLAGVFFGRTDPPRVEVKPQKGLQEVWRGLKTVKKSKVLPWLMVMIGIVQVVLTLVDYQFNGWMAEQYPDKNERAAAIGRVYFAVSAVTLGLQGASGVFFSLLGVRGVLLLMPAVMGTLLSGMVMVASPVLAQMAKIVGKALDYSLGRGCKELIYIPLSHDERTQGKSFVDIAAYRVAKGAVSILLLVMIAYNVSVKNVSLLASFLAVLWLSVSVVLGNRHKKVHEQDALSCNPGLP